MSHDDVHTLDCISSFYINNHALLAINNTPLAETRGDRNISGHAGVGLLPPSDSVSLVDVEAGQDEVLTLDEPLTPLVLSDLLDRDPGRRVVVEHLLDEVLEVLADGALLALGKLRPEELSGLALPELIVEVDARERILPHDHHEEGHTQGEDVSGLAVVGNAALDLGSDVVLGTDLLLVDGLLSGLRVRRLRRVAEVSQSQAEVLPNEDVLQLDVAVTHALLMTVRYGGEQLLREEEAPDVFGEAAGLLDDVKELVLAVLESK